MDVFINYQDIWQDADDTWQREVIFGIPLRGISKIFLSKSGRSSLSRILSHNNGRLITFIKARSPVR
jgi:hypothetical protein